EADGALEDAGLLHVPVHAEEANAAVVKVVDRRELRELLAAEDEGGRHRCDRLEVVHRRRAAERAGLGGEGGLEARLAALALERVEERRLLAADLRARAGVDDDVDRVVLPEG